MISKIVKSLSVSYELLRFAVQSSDLVFVTGLPSVGKTTITRTVLDAEATFRYAYINCSNFASSSKLFLDILRQLQEQLDFKIERHKKEDTLLSALEFVELYALHCTKALDAGIKRLFIVLDQAELFRKTPIEDSIMVLLNDPHVKLIFVSCEMAYDYLETIKYPSVRTKVQDRMQVVEINVWTERDIVAEILKQLPEQSVELYKKFVHNVVATAFVSNTKDFLQLRSFCQQRYPSFLSDYKLKIFNHLKEIGDVDSIAELDKIDLDEYAINAHLQTKVSSFLNAFKDVMDKIELSDLGETFIDRRVVYYTCDLIIAVYIAAFTRPADDKKNFVKYQKRLNKRSRLDKHDSTSKPFTMERLVQIYRGIVNLQTMGSDDKNSERFEVPDSVLGDIKLLEDLNLIRIVSGDGQSMLTRYKLSSGVSRSYVEDLCKRVDIPLEQLSGL